MKLARTAFLSFLIAAFTFVPMELIPADAVSTAIATNNVTATSISTATFVVYATTASNGANPGAALVLPSSSTTQYFYVRNTGTVQVLRFNLSVTRTAAASLGIRRCDQNVIFSGSNTCASGSSTTVTTTPGVLTLTIPANSWFHFQVTTNRTTVRTISVSVASSQIRTPLVTHS